MRLLGFAEVVRPSAQEVSAATTTGTGVAMTQASVNVVQVLGLVIATLGLAWNIYAVITRNRHNRFLREQAAERRRRD